jgi:hypothetical protein
MSFFEGLIKTYKSKAYPGSLRDSGKNKGQCWISCGTNPNPFVTKDKSSPTKAGKVRDHAPPADSEASGASGAADPDSGDEHSPQPDRGRSTTKAGSGTQPRASSPYHSSQKQCPKGDNCYHLNKLGKCSVSAHSRAA